jgi:hypothetical protein
MLPFLTDAAGLTRCLPRLYVCASLFAAHRGPLKPMPHVRNVLTDSHFLIPLAIFLIGLAMLIAVH